MTSLIIVNFIQKKQKARLEEPSNNISERLTGRKPVRNEVTSERDNNSRTSDSEELLVLSAIYYFFAASF